MKQVKRIDDVVVGEAVYSQGYLWEVKGIHYSKGFEGSKGYESKPRYVLSVEQIVRFDGEALRDPRRSPRPPQPQPLGAQA